MTIILYDWNIPPICEVEGCTANAQDTGHRRKNGSIVWRRPKWVKEGGGYCCGTHHTNSWHPYRKYRKNYCENEDGRLGFSCNYPITEDGQLTVHHEDGDATNNEEPNLTTYCRNCHYVADKQGETHLTIGRVNLRKQGIKVA
jgi:hypothetical protein